MTARADGRILALLGIVLLSLGMRSATSSFAPVFSFIDADLHLGTLVLGVVGAVPLFAFAASGFVAPRLTRSLGLEGAMVAAAVAIVVGQVGRGVALEAAGVIAGTAVTMFGIGIANVLLPPVVKRYFPRRIGLLTAVYSTLFGFGAAGPGFLAVPLSDTWGWRLVIVSWAVTVALALVPWIALARRPRVADVDPELGDAPPPVVRSMAREPIAWALAAVLAASAVAGYGAVTWLPPILQDVLGFAAADAATYVGLLLTVSIPAAILVPIIASRPRAASLVVAAAVLAGGVGWGGFLVAPGFAPLLWALLIGAGSITFSLTLVQIGVRTATPYLAARLSGFVQGLAYVASGVIVFSLGVLHTLTGEWTASIAVALAAALLPIPAVVILARPGRIGEAAG